MNKLILTTLVTAIFFSMYTSYALGKEFHVDGYTVTVKWKQKGANTLKVWGDVYGGKKCKQLNLQISLDNTKTSSANAFIETYIEDYSRSGHDYHGLDIINGKRDTRRNWFIDSINIKCLN